MDKKNFKLTDFLRTGFGYDSHRFLTEDEIAGAKNSPVETGTDFIDPGKPLILGGEVVGGFPPFKARSDGDVVYHAAVNAVLSALSDDKARDIGTLFPNTDTSNTNRPSSDFLKHVGALVKERHFIINDLKLTIKGRPRADLSKVKKNLAAILEVPENSVLVQGTSGEGMDAAGQGRGVEVFGICTLVGKDFLKKFR